MAEKLTQAQRRQKAWTIKTGLKTMPDVETIHRAMIKKENARSVRAAQVRRKYSRNASGGSSGGHGGR